MKKKIACLFSICLFIAVLFSPSALALDETYYANNSYKGTTLNVYNWGEYISDGSDDSLDVVSYFEELTGIKVHYTTFASNEEMYAKIKSGGAVYDVIIPSEYMIARMMNEGMLQKLDLSNIPNFALVGENYKYLEYDPQNEYSVPYMWGTTGIVYNTTMIDEIPDSWDILWDERFMNNILMFSNSRDAFAISLKRLGYSFNDTDADHIEEAATELKNQKMLVQAYVMDEIFNKMEGGEAAVAPYYAGDAITMMSENQDLAFFFPKEGVNYFVDAMAIPLGSKNKGAAELFINFMCEPEISAANAEIIGYSTPIDSARELLDMSEEALAIAYPSAEILEKSEVFSALPEETNTLIDREWTDILSYNENPNEWIMPVFLVACIAASIIILIIRARKKKNKIF